MAEYFNILLQDYKCVKFPVVPAYRKTNAWRNFLTIIELIPAEQEPSLVIDQASTVYCDVQKMICSGLRCTNKSGQ